MTRQRWVALLLAYDAFIYLVMVVHPNPDCSEIDGGRMPLAMFWLALALFGAHVEAIVAVLREESGA